MAGGRCPHRTSRPDRRHSDAPTRSESDITGTSDALGDAIPAAPYSGNPGLCEDLNASMAVFPGTPPPPQAPPPPKLPTKPKGETVDAETDKRKPTTIHDKKRKPRPGAEPDTILPWRLDSRDNFPVHGDIFGERYARRPEGFGLLGSPGQRMVSAYPQVINDADIDGRDDEGNQGGQPGQLGQQEDDGDWDMLDVDCDRDTADVDGDWDMADVDELNEQGQLS